MGALPSAFHAQNDRTTVDLSRLLKIGKISHIAKKREKQLGIFICIHHIISMINELE